MRNVFLIGLGSILIIFSMHGMTSAELTPEMGNEILSLDAEIDALTAAEKTLHAERASLQSEEKRLISTKELLDGAAKNFRAEVETLKNDYRAHSIDAENQKNEASRHNAAIVDHNSRCVGTFEDKSYVASCNAAAGQLNAHTTSVVNPWADRVNARKQQLGDRRNTLLMKQQAIRERSTDLQRQVLDWTRRKKENNYKLNELEARRHSIQQRLAAIWNSQAIKDLEQRNKLSQECRRLAESADPNNLNDTRLEQAHRCLQRIWDGAR